MKIVTELISYGSISNNFAKLANFSKIINIIENLKQTRLDCYQYNTATINQVLKKKFTDCGLELPSNVEIFAPSKNYPMHVDDGGISYFIPLEEGVFQIGGVNYPIVPFVLYSFEDSMLHNSNFVSIMLK